MKLWDRAEPIKSALLWAIGAFVLMEALLLLSGKWVLTSQSEGTGNDSFYYEGTALPATQYWTILNCTYWTGRSMQTVQYGGQFSATPKECPFIAKAR